MSLSTATGPSLPGNYGADIDQQLSKKPVSDFVISVYYGKEPATMPRRRAGFYGEVFNEGLKSRPSRALLINRIFRKISINSALH